MRFSLRTMFVAFTVVALSTAGLLYANAAWAAFFYTAAFALLLTGLVGAVVRRGATRPYWIGFTILGGGYFLLALVNENFLARFTDVRQSIGQEPRLATSQFLLWVEPYIHSNRELPNRSPTFPTRMSFTGSGLTLIPSSPSDYFVEVGHSILTLLLALLGGWIGLIMSNRNQSSG